ncbi:MAG: hypothetical protein IKM51_04620 [Oscillospiraceae bacterium]|nr:hypothetical protein [Oscillospiraceae bacterium]
MKCPQCQSEMIVDNHRKIPLQMCYQCGYIEGRSVHIAKGNVTNFVHCKSLNINELASFMAEGLDMDREELIIWLNADCNA